MKKIIKIKEGTKELYSNPLHYWIDGSTTKNIELPIVKNGEPYCVRISESGWLPVNYMVFATTEDQAVKIVVDSIEKCLSKVCYQGSFDRKGSVDHYRKLLKNGDIEVEKIITNQVFKIGWGEHSLA